MKNMLNRLTLGVMTLLLVSSWSCASFQLLSPLPLDQRPLRISPDIAGFEYEYQICTKKFIGICTERAMHTDYYDLTDKAVRMKLIDMGFVARIGVKP